MKACFPMIAVLVAAAGFLSAAERGHPPRSGEDLAYSAEFIQKKLDELLTALSDAADLLEKSDPETAGILRRTVLYARQEDTVGKIDLVRQRLREGLDQAAHRGQTEVIRDLTHMLRLLEGAAENPEELRRRIAELQSMRRRLAALRKRQAAEEVRTRSAVEGNPSEAVEQKEIARHLADVAGKMKAGDGGTALPGQPSAAQAGRCAAQAGEFLQRGEAGRAHTRQKETLAHLDRAIRALDRRSEALRRRLQQRTLADLSERLESVLDRQRDCTKRTRSVYAARAASEPWYDRPARQTLSALAHVEGDLAEETGAIHDLLQKEGTTVVFPAVLFDVRRDLSDVQKRLAAADPGPQTQTGQEEIEHTLEELLEAVRKELSQGPGRRAGGGDGGGGRGQPSLLPPLAELRMLRLKQLRINRQTRRLSEMPAGEMSPAERDAAQEELARRQGEVLQWIREIRARLSQPGGSRSDSAPEETP